MYIHVKSQMPKMKKHCSPLDLDGTGYCASFNFRRTARAVTRLYDTALQESGIRSTQFAILVRDRKSTRLNSSHVSISYAVFCLKKKKKQNHVSYIHNSI